MKGYPHSTPANSDIEHGTRHIELTPDYVTGFCDGEASFTYGRNGNNIRLRFSIGLNEEDKPLIIGLQSFFGVGGVYWTPRNGARAPAWTYCVTRLNEIGRIVEHFKNFPLLGKKADSFKVWKQMYELKIRKRDTDWGEIINLASILSSFTTKGRKSVKPVWMAHD